MMKQRRNTASSYPSSRLFKILLIGSILIPTLYLLLVQLYQRIETANSILIVVARYILYFLYPTQILLMAMYYEDGPVDIYIVFISYLLNIFLYIFWGWCLWIWAKYKFFPVLLIPIAYTTYWIIKLISAILSFYS